MKFDKTMTYNFCQIVVLEKIVDIGFDVVLFESGGDLTIIWNNNKVKNVLVHHILHCHTKFKKVKKYVCFYFVERYILYLNDLNFTCNNCIECQMFTGNIKFF